MVPLNLCPPDGQAAYIVTGHWAKKAYQEATKVGRKAVLAATTETEKKTFHRIPKQEEIKLEGDLAYVHLCSNNTIFGSEWQEYPNVGSYTLVGDLSSDFLSRPVDVAKFGLIYAGAQKNVGPAGVTIVIGHKDLLARDRSALADAAGIGLLLRIWRQIAQDSFQAREDGSERRIQFVRKTAGKDPQRRKPVRFRQTSFGRATCRAAGDVDDAVNRLFHFDLLEFPLGERTMDGGDAIDPVDALAQRFSRRPSSWRGWSSSSRSWETRRVFGFSTRCWPVTADGRGGRLS